MKNILIIGSTGQIGSELTRELRKTYGSEHVIAGYIRGAEPKGELKDGGPSAPADVTDAAMIADVIKKYDIDTIYNLCCSRIETAFGMENRDRRSLEYLGSCPRKQMFRIYAKLYRFIRSRHT